MAYQMIIFENKNLVSRAPLGMSVFYESPNKYPIDRILMHTKYDNT